MALQKIIWYQHADTQFLSRATWNCRPATPETVHKSQADSCFSLSLKLYRGVKLDIGIGGSIGAFALEANRGWKGGNAMLNVYTVSFFGHREVERYRETEEALEKVIYQLLTEHEYVEFLIGRSGEFDQLVSSTVHRVRKRLDCSNSSLVLVLPYVTAEFRDNEDSFYAYYDEVEVCQSASEGHFKAAIQTRNKEMVDRSDLVIFNVDHASGGAYQTMKYANKREAAYINISVKGMEMRL